MKDIKIKKVKVEEVEQMEIIPVVLNSNKTIEVESNLPYNTFEKNSIRNYSKISVLLFGFMTASIICYIFMISSSIFYAVKRSQFSYINENVKSISLNNEKVDISLENKKNNSRISYINKESDTAISLK